MVKLRVQQFTAESNHHARQLVCLLRPLLHDCVLTDCLYPFVLRSVATYLRVKDEAGNDWVDEVVVLSYHNNYAIILLTDFY